MPIVKTFDIRELDDKTGVAGLVTVYFPYYDKIDIDKPAKEFSEYAHSVGYDLSDHTLLDLDEKLTDKDGKIVNVIQLTYEAKFYKKEFKLPEWLYHITTLEAAKKILKRGFIVSYAKKRQSSSEVASFNPKSENKTYTYQDRTYLFASLRPIDIMAALLSKELLKDNNQKFVMLRIAKDKLTSSNLYKTSKMTFYVDPKYSMDNDMPIVIYTHNNIPASLIDGECVTFNVREQQIVDVKQKMTSIIIL